MSGAAGSVADLGARAHKGRPSVEQRIDRRLEVLREWLNEGVAAGKNIPRGLNAVRKWHDSQLGIEPIASPNDFTTTHPVYGSRVRDIAGLLTALKKKFDSRSAKSSEASSPAVKFDRKEADRQLQAAVSQWHSERHASQRYQQQAESAAAHNVLLQAELNQKDQLIADLRSKLASQTQLRVVK